MFLFRFVFSWLKKKKIGIQWSTYRRVVISNPSEDANVLLVKDVDKYKVCHALLCCGFVRGTLLQHRRSLGKCKLTIKSILFIHRANSNASIKTIIFMTLIKKSNLRNLKRIGVCSPLPAYIWKPKCWLSLLYVRFPQVGRNKKNQKCY